MLEGADAVSSVVVQVTAGFGFVKPRSSVPVPRGSRAGIVVPERRRGRRGGRRRPRGRRARKRRSRRREVHALLRPAQLTRGSVPGSRSLLLGGEVPQRALAPVAGAGGDPRAVLARDLVERHAPVPRRAHLALRALAHGRSQGSRRSGVRSRGAIGRGLAVAELAPRRLDRTEHVRDGLIVRPVVVRTHRAGFERARHGLPIARSADREGMIVTRVAKRRASAKRPTGQLTRGVLTGADCDAYENFRECFLSRESRKMAVLHFSRLARRRRPPPTFIFASAAPVFATAQ